MRADWCEVCNASQWVNAAGEHECGTSRLGRWLLRTWRAWLLGAHYAGKSRGDRVDG